MSRLSVRSLCPGFLSTSALAFVLALGAGCDTGVTAIPGWPDDAGTSGDGGVIGAGTGLPCDVALVLVKRCSSCHGAVPAGGAPESLVTRDDLLTVSPTYPGETYAQRSVTRMQAGTMPPGGGATAADIQVISDWIAAGTPASDCGGSGGDGGTLPGPDPLNAAATCTSNQTVRYTTRESSDMNPGYACIACHVQYRGPNLAVGGTVYPSGHEPDLCVSAPSGDAYVVISDMSGNDVKRLYVSPYSGNFNWRGFSATLPQPYKARVEYNGWTRAMATAQTSGDCNACHTQTGAQNAPGRITLPYM